ncbi:VOC family protein [Mumia zhuanghuii]|uniref:VOC family protein n=2 Tax=Mumia TaxID=1546255 RepID=A0ABW1QIV2_9ACTN|nr:MULTISPECIES: VOC family protein [Mumia]KAA1424753.1 VOC family protein [Mumia zhuanghuii]
MTVSPRWITAFLDQPAANATGALGLWQAITGTEASPTRGERGEFRTLLPPRGDAYLRFQVVRHGMPRVHLDLHVDDIADGRDAAVAAGADVVAEPGTHVVLASPGGMPFCVVPDEGEREVPPAPTWPGGHRSVVDQVCLDIPAEHFERECAFWADVTGWTVQDGGREEFLRLVRPSSMPLGILLQRLDSPPPSGGVTAHLDLAAGEQGADAEVERLRLLGPVERWRSDRWITLVDPFGRIFCVTRREP